MATVAPSTPHGGRSAFWDNVRTIAYALILAMGIRFALAQPFRIPSGSMQPTLLVGDYIVVTKWSYGYSRFSTAPFILPGPAGRLLGREPKRGDVVVFRSVPQEDKDFVKRLIGLPGDRIQMIDGRLNINGQPVKRESTGATAFKEATGDIVEIETWRETLPDGVSYTTFDRDPEGRYDTTPVYVVPPGEFFMMGDDRDNSADSRTVEMGMVPFDHLVGHAQFVFASFDPESSLLKPWTLFTGFRADRFFKGIQ
jgi:signal peptidase I